MEHTLLIYNTLSRRKEAFEPLHAPNVGMYVCGPTVYGDPHLGHARPAITFDIVFRYLRHLGYKVRYVRNITDVGHLEHDADEGDDKIAKKARLEQLEPMEIAQHYTNRYHEAMNALGVLPPSIEPHATGHIIEQQQLVQQIIDNGYAYESNGSVYFDVEKYNRDHKYGILSGRNLDDVINASRELDGVGEKRNQVDFALWKKALPEHIMRWPSRWSDVQRIGFSPISIIGLGFRWLCSLILVPNPPANITTFIHLLLFLISIYPYFIDCSIELLQILSHTDYSPVDILSPWQMHPPPSLCLPCGTD